MVIEFEALRDGESPLTFQFEPPHMTEVTADGASVLSDYVDGSNSNVPTAIDVLHVSAHERARSAWVALIVMGGLLVAGAGRRWMLKA